MMPDRGCARILFSRLPVPGKVKTRLKPVLSDERCAALQEALIIDTALKLLELGDAMVFCYSDEGGPASDGGNNRGWDGDGGHCFDRLYSRMCSDCPDGSRIVAFPQEGDDFGARLRNAFAQAFAAGVDRCLLLGSDLPYVMPADIAAAEQLLADADVVFGPSADGGFWLVGMREPFPELFENEAYGRDGALALALETCRRHGKTVAFAPASPDVDTPRDLEMLRERIAAGEPCIGLHTRSELAACMLPTVYHGRCER